MLSVIVCSRGGSAAHAHAENVAATAGTDHEYLPIDNSSGGFGICAAYNRGAQQARGDIFLFVHEDVFFLEPGWGAVLEKKFRARPSCGLVGLAGTQHLCAHDMRWFAAGRPFLRGRVLHQLAGGRLILTVFSWDKSDADVVAVDGLFLAIRADLFGRIRFDEENFPGFHFYDLDICMQVGRTHRCMVTWEILVKHLSAGKNDRSWHDSATSFSRKWASMLPAACAPGIPDPERNGGAVNYDLTAQINQRPVEKAA